jgi:hypothetical protein
VIVWPANDEQTAPRELLPQSEGAAARQPVIEQLGRRCALVMLASLTLSVTMGLVAWGPIVLSEATHRYADERVWLGLTSGANVWVNMVMFVAATWGWHATRNSRWAVQLRTPWQLFHVCVMTSAVFAGLYHAQPGNALFVLTHISAASGFVMLTLGMLAERVHARFGSRLVCGLVLAGTALTGGAMLLGHSLGGVLDMRPLLLLEIIPVLVIPAGALSLAGRFTQASDWVVVLTFYAISKLLEANDASVLNATGWISGHTLMHVALTGAVAWMSYRAVLARAAPHSAWSSTGSGESSHRDTSLNTTG